MEETMKVAVMLDKMKMGWENRPIPIPTDDEVLVKIDYVGICGSDMHYYENGRIGEYIVQPPFVLGHESGGVVTEVGKNVKHLKKGDRVALEPGKTCGHCEVCRSGKYNLCPDVKFFATPPVDGVFQEYIAHDADLCFKLPDNVSTMEGALIEPLSVGMHAAKQAGASLGYTAVVMGAGCIGLCAMMSLKAFGVTEVYVIDIMKKRLEKAEELGATGIINSQEKDPVRELLRITNNRGCDIVVEASGVEDCVNQGLEILTRGGTLVQVAYSGSGYMNLNMGLLCDKEITIKSVFRYRHIYPTAIKAVSSGLINLKGIVTDVFDFEKVEDAMNKSISDKANIVKAVIKMR